MAPEILLALMNVVLYNLPTHESKNPLSCGGTIENRALNASLLSTAIPPPQPKPLSPPSPSQLNPYNHRLFTNLLTHSHSHPPIIQIHRNPLYLLPPPFLTFPSPLPAHKIPRPSTNDLTHSLLLLIYIASLNQINKVRYARTCLSSVRFVEISTGVC